MYKTFSYNTKCHDFICSCCRDYICDNKLIPNESVTSCIENLESCLTKRIVLHLLFCRRIREWDAGPDSSYIIHIHVDIRSYSEFKIPH